MADKDHNKSARSLDEALKTRIGSDEERLFGVHPDGIGQTLGGDLLRPNRGRDVPTEAEEDDEA